MGKSVADFVSVRLSLADLVGQDYVQSVVRAASAVRKASLETLRRLATTRVDFLPARFQSRLASLLPKTGTVVTKPFAATRLGASSAPFVSATRTAAAPLTGFGYFRIGEDGRLYLISKSEHYHASLGHSFPGYKLLEVAKRLGIPNATHNNTRGLITRTLEQELTYAASAGGAKLDRVLNLETGSLAVEAAFKMILSRFYRSQEDSPEPKYKGQIPVFLVIGNDNGGLQGNYHGTTILCQTLRGMWPEFAAILERAGAIVVKAVRPNNLDDVKQVFAQYDLGKHKVAAFFHEIVMMNYGAKVLTPEFLGTVYEMCGKRDVATVDDEIQSCLWHPDLFMFKEWGLKPSFVAVGKGFPGGEYPASRILFKSEFDLLPQFGALVTNGQEELASLAYLVTMAWAKANSDATRRLGDYFEMRLRETAGRHKGLVASVDGSRHMLGIGFNDVAEAKAVATELNAGGLDISVQTYKADCPPSALLKLPLIMGKVAMDFVIERIDAALAKVESPKTKRMKA
jgi:4-aminobutyrate aminotransferase-like enzyme